MDKCRLMLVDDDALMRDVMRDFISLCMDGFEVVAEAANGREAVDKARSEDPDVILMDVRMPLMDGIQATRSIKQEYNLKAVVVTATSFSWHEIKDAARHAGASLHIQKPFDLEAVRDVLWEARTGLYTPAHAAVGA